MESSTNYSDAQQNVCSGIVVDRLFIALSVTYFTASVLSIFVSSVVWMAVRKTTLFPENVKLLLTNVAVGATVASIGMFIKAVYSVAVSVRQSEIVGRPVTWCKLLVAPQSTSTTAISLFIVGIGVDRFRATRNVARNSATVKNDGATKRAKIYAVCVWLFTIISVSISSVKDVFNAGSATAKCYCSKMTSMNNVEEIFYVLVLVSFQAITLALFLYVYRKNKRAYMRFNLTTTSHSLHQRYQLTNNMKSTTMIIPYLIVHLITSIVSCVVYLLHNNLVAKVGGIGDGSASLNFDMIFANTSVVDLLIAPLLWLRYHESLKKAACTSFPLLSHLLNYRNDASSISSLVNAINVDEKYANSKDKDNENAFSYRLRPEKADEILQNVWATKPQNGKR